MRTVTDTVLDQSGRPLPGASVTVRTLEGELVESLTTDEAGEWSADFDPGTYVMVISKGNSVITRPLEVCPFEIVPGYRAWYDAQKEPTTHE